MVLLTTSVSLALLQRLPTTSTEITVYFSPKGGATDAILKELTAARSEIKVQAYSFTSAPIAQAVR